MLSAACISSMGRSYAPRGGTASTGRESSPIPAIVGALRPQDAELPSTWFFREVARYG